MTNVSADIHYRNVESEGNHDVIRNTILMTIDGSTYLIRLGFTNNAAQTLSDRIKALIYKDLHTEKAVPEILS